MRRSTGGASGSITACCMSGVPKSRVWTEARNPREPSNRNAARRWGARWRWSRTAADHPKGRIVPGASRNAQSPRALCRAASSTLSARPRATTICAPVSSASSLRSSSFSAVTRITSRTSPSSNPSDRAASDRPSRASTRPTGIITVRGAGSDRVSLQIRYEMLGTDSAPV